MIFQNLRVKRSIQNILKSKTAVSLIFKFPDEFPDTMAVTEITSYLDSYGLGNKYIIGKNYNKKTGNEYYKVLADNAVPFDEFKYKVSGSRVGKKLKLDDYMQYFNDECVYIR